MGSVGLHRDLFSEIVYVIIYHRTHMNRRRLYKFDIRMFFQWLAINTETATDPSNGSSCLHANIILLHLSMIHDNNHGISIQRTD